MAVNHVAVVAAGMDADNYEPMKRIILSNTDNFRQVEEEAKYDFTIYVLQTLGLPEEPLSECFPEEGFAKFSAQDKINLRNLLRKFSITIIEEKYGELKIYVEKELVAHWKKSHHILKKDDSILRREDRLYTEIHTEYWTIFDEENKNVGN